MSLHGKRHQQGHRRRPTAVLRHGTIAMCGASIALLAAMPTASALADSTTHVERRGTPLLTAPRPQGVAGELLPAGRLEELLADLPLRDLSAAQLAHYLAGLEDVGALASLQVGLLGTEELGLAHLEEGLTKSIEQLGASATLGELENTGDLLPAIEGRLEGLLSTLLGAALDTEQKQQLSETLERLGLAQLVSSLLSSATEPSQLSSLADLADGLVEELGPSAVEGLLGSTVEGPFVPTNVESAAKELGTTSEALSGELGQSGTALPATATMLTAPVTGGKLLALAPAVKGLALGLLGAPSSEEASGSSQEEGGTSKGGGNGSGEGKGSGGSGQGGSGTGGSGGTSGSGTPGSGGSGGGTGGLTLVLDLPSTNATTPTPASPGPAKAGKVQIRSWRTKGAVATLVLQAPAAGRLTLHGHGLRSKTVRVAKARRLTLAVKLSKAQTASLHRHRRTLKVRLMASFTSTTQASSSAAVTLDFS
jgi:hypothetical protein